MMLYIVPFRLFSIDVCLRLTQCLLICVSCVTSALNEDWSGFCDAQVLDTPEFFWSAPDAMQNLYKVVCDYMELDNRVEVLNNRLMVCHTAY